MTNGPDGDDVFPSALSGGYSKGNDPTTPNPHLLQAIEEDHRARTEEVETSSTNHSLVIVIAMAIVVCMIALPVAWFAFRISRSDQKTQQGAPIHATVGDEMLPQGTAIDADTSVNPIPSKPSPREKLAALIAAAKERKRSREEESRQSATDSSEKKAE